MSETNTWTLPQLREARDRWLAGETWAEVGARYGVKPSTVRTMVHRQFGQPKRKGRRPPEERGADP